VVGQDEQVRGLAFEDFLRRCLFALHDLDPRGGFSSPGEQIDGSFRLDNQLSGRGEMADRYGLAVGRALIPRQAGVKKLDNTLGIFIAVNGFTDEAAKRAAVDPAKIILVEGLDLAPLVQDAWDLVEVLRRKLRRAAETGDVLGVVG